MCSPFGESNGKCICAAQWCVRVAVVRRFSSASLVRFVVGVERQKAFFYYKNPKAAFSACPFLLSSLAIVVRGVSVTVVWGSRRQGPGSMWVQGWRRGDAQGLEAAAWGETGHIWPLRAGNRLGDFNLVLKQDFRAVLNVDSAYSHESACQGDFCLHLAWSNGFLLFTRMNMSSVLKRSWKFLTIFRDPDSEILTLWKILVNLCGGQVSCLFLHDFTWVL